MSTFIYCQPSRLSRDMWASKRAKMYQRSIDMPRGLQDRFPTVLWLAILLYILTCGPGLQRNELIILIFYSSHSGRKKCEFFLRHTAENVVGLSNNCQSRKLVCWNLTGSSAICRPRTQIPPAQICSSRVHMSLLKCAYPSNLLTVCHEQAAINSILFGQ